MCSSYEFAYSFCSQAIQHRREILDDFGAGEGVAQIGRAHLHRRGAGQQHFRRVLRGGDPAQPDHRNRDGPGHLPDHAQRQGEDGGAGEPAGKIGEDGPAGLEVDAQGHHGVDEAQGVRPRVFAGAGDGHDVRHVGRELHDDGLFRHGLHGACDCRRGCRVGAEAHAAAVDVGAADVDLQPAHLGLRVQPPADLHIFLHRKAADVCDHRLVEDRLEPGQLLPDHRVHPGVLQPHGVQHPRRRLRDAGRGVSEAGGEGGALHGEGAEAVQVVERRELVAVAEGAGGGDDGVCQLDPAEGDAQSVHSRSSFSNTGPSLQTRRGPFAV